MKKRLLWIDNPKSFASRETGEIINGGYIAYCNVDFEANNEGKGCHVSVDWVSDNDLLNKLVNDPRSNELPQVVEIEVEIRDMKHRPRIKDVTFVK